MIVAYDELDLYPCVVRLKTGGWLAENTDAPGFTEASDSSQSTSQV